MYLYDSIKENEHEAIRWNKLVKVKSKQTIHHFKCNNCGEEFTRNKNGKLRETEVHFCKGCFSFSLAQKETAKVLAKKAEERGEKFDRGYKEIYVGNNYPFRESKWVREHILVIEEQIGKRIPKGMVVHHIDGDKRNNNLDNLLLCKVEEHNNCHAKIEQLVFELYKDGIVGFDKDSKKYFIKNKRIGV